MTQQSPVIDVHAHIVFEALHELVGHTHADIKASQTVAVVLRPDELLDVWVIDA